MNSNFLHLVKSAAVLLFILFSLETFAQDPLPEDFDQVMTLTDFWETVFSDDTVNVFLENVYVITKDRDEYSKVSKSILSKKKIVNKEIEVNNIYFKGHDSEYSSEYISRAFLIDSTTFQQSIKLSNKRSSRHSFSKLPI